MTEQASVLAQVVPDIATFAVDDGFRYRIPADMHVEVGHRVRIRVSGRRRRGYVTAILPDDDSDGVLDIDGVVGTLPSFTTEDLPLLRWCATHYVAPLSTVLKRTVPPNVPRATQRALSVRSDKPSAAAVTVARAPHGRTVADLLGSLAADESALVLVPTHVEAETIAAELGDRAVLAHSGLANKETTEAWSVAATTPGTVLVGTRETVLWPVAGLSKVVLVEDARRVMKSPATPTFGVREIATHRTQSAGIDLHFVTPMPTLEVLETVDASLSDPSSARGWGLVEIVDRTEEPPTGAALVERARKSIVTGAKQGWSVFVLVPRRGYARAVRCARCGQLRVCAVCDAAVAADGVCVRCGATCGPCVACGQERWQPIGAGIGSVVDDLRRVLGSDVGPAEAAQQVRVGTERDLVGADRVDLAVAVDLDSVSRAPTYRAAEDALRLGVRLSHLVKRGSGRRMVVQTSDATQPVVEALRSGHWQEFMVREAGMRRAAGFPPFGQLIAIEVSDAVDDLDEQLRALSPTARVMGPATMRDRTRWLIQGDDLDGVRVRLRPIVRRLRDAGTRVRVDVDPIDL